MPIRETYETTIIGGADDFSNTNPTLEEGQFAIVQAPSSTGIEGFVIGDGVTPFNDLSPFDVTGESVFSDAASLIADTVMTYGDDGRKVKQGQVIRTALKGLTYKVAASDATDAPVETAGGVKLYPQAPYHFDQFGIYSEANAGQASASGGSGNAALIQAAHDWVADNGGGEIWAEGLVPFDDEIYWGDGDHQVTLRGYGRGGIRNSKFYTHASAATRFMWTGGNNKVGFTLTGDRDDTGNKQRPLGGGVLDVMFDGAESSSIGFKVWSHAGHQLRILLLHWGGDCQFLSDVNHNSYANNGRGDNQDFDWDIITYQILTSNEADAEVVITGKYAADRTGSSFGANTSRGVARIYAYGESSSVGVHLGNSDTIFFPHFIANTRDTATGDGGKVFFHADDTMPAAFSDGHARYHAFGMLQCDLVAKETVAGTKNSGPNNILHYTRGNEKGAATVETNAQLNWWDSEDGLHTTQIAVQDGITAPSATTGYAQIFVDSSDGDLKVIFADGTTKTIVTDT